MVQDARRPDPQYKGLIHGTGQIIKNEGFRGVYRGLFPVIMKQGTNSAVRFTSYQSGYFLMYTSNRFIFMTVKL